MFAKTTEHGDYCYNNTLVGDNEEFQWSICLAEIVPNGAGNGLPAYEVTNRKWQCVGPVFRSRSEGAKWLGGDKVREHQDQLVEEYNGLYSDEIETRERFNPENRPKFGRPSQGRDRRLQFSTSAKVENWLESQKQGAESVSQTIHRILEERMQERKSMNKAKQTAQDAIDLAQEEGIDDEDAKWMAVGAVNAAAREQGIIGDELTAEMNAAAQAVVKQVQK